MKFFVTLISFVLITYMASAQQEIRKIYGSFIEGGKVFNYEFTQNQGVGYSLEFLPVSQINPYESMSKSFVALEKLDVDSTFKLLRKEIGTTIKNLDETQKSNTNISPYLSSEDTSKKTLKKHLDSLTKIDISLNEVIKAFKFISNKINEINIRQEKIPSILENKDVVKLKSFEKFKKYFGEINEIKSVDSVELFNRFIKGDSLIKYFNILKSEIDSKAVITSKYQTIYDNLMASINKINVFLENGSIKQPSSFYDFTPEVFGGIIEKQLTIHDSELLAILDKSVMEGDKSENDLKEFKNRLYYIIKTRLEFQDTQPMSAIMMLKNNKIKIYKDIKSNILVDIFTVKTISVEFEDGVIKNIEALMLSDVDDDNSLGTPKRFRNIKPIGISGKFHPDLFMNYKLFHSSKDKLFYLELSDLLAYYPQLTINTENYAPENSVVTLDPATGKTLVELKKEKTAEIIDVQIYSDLAGVQLGNPQGLIQVNFSKKIDIFSKYKQKTKNVVNHNYSFLRYVKPELIISKIDQKDQFLVFNKETPKLKVTDIYQYQFIKFGADINFFKYSIPNAQLNFQVMLKTCWYGANIIDSVNNEKYKSNLDVNLKGERIFANSSRLGLIIESKPENRWGAKLRWDFIGYNDILSKEIGFYKSEDKPFRSKNLKILAFESFVKTSINSKFFFRWAYNYSGNYQYYNQLQIGIQSTLQRYLEDNKPK